MSFADSLAHLNASKAESEAADAELKRLHSAAKAAITAGVSSDAVAELRKAVNAMRAERERLYRVTVRARIDYRDRRAA